MNSSVALAGILLLGSFVAHAQDGMGGPPPDGGIPGEMQHHGPNTDQEVKKLTLLLALTSDQQTQIRTILTDRNQQIGDLFKAQFHQKPEDGPPSRESMDAMRKQVKVIRAASVVAIMSLLSDDQKSKFESWAQKDARSDSHDDNGMPPPPPDGEGGPPPDGGGGPGGGGPPEV